MMKRNLWFSNLCALLAAVLAAATVFAALRWRSEPPILLEASQEAQGCIQGFLDAVTQGDFPAAEQRLAGNPALELQREDRDPVQALLWEAYLLSLQYTLTGEMASTDRGLTQDVTIRHLDVAAAAEAIGPLARQQLLEKADETVDTDELYDTAGNYRPELVSQVLLQAAETALENPPMAETSLTLLLSYQGGSWRVEPSQELLNLLCGSIG